MPALSKFTVVPDDLAVEADLLGMFRRRHNKEVVCCPVVAEHESCVKIRVIAVFDGTGAHEYSPGRLLPNQDKESASQRDRCKEVIVELKQVLVTLGAAVDDRWLDVSKGRATLPLYIRYCPQCTAYFYIWDWLESTL